MAGNARTSLRSSARLSTSTGRAAAPAPRETPARSAEAAAEAARRRARAAERAREVEDSPRVVRDKCRLLARALRNAKHLVVYTGAGISTAADIPDYRGPRGVWTRLRRGEAVGRVEVSRAQPTLTHMALTALWARGTLKFVVSQNCDGLHVRAGLPRKALAELHGDMFCERCARCRRVYLRAFDTTERTARHAHGTRRLCHSCGAELCDTIVHFGERGRAAWPLNWAGALRHAAAADVVLCLGSSLKVLRRYPRLWRMQRAPQDRPALYIVNLQWTPKDAVAALKINARCDEVMALVARRLRLRVPRYEPRADPLLAHAVPLAPLEAHTTRRPLLSPPPARHRSPSSASDWESPSASDSDEELPLRHLAERMRGPRPRRSPPPPVQTRVSPTPKPPPPRTPPTPKPPPPRTPPTPKPPPQRTPPTPKPPPPRTPPTPKPLPPLLLPTPKPTPPRLPRPPDLLHNIQPSPPPPPLELPPPLPRIPPAPPPPVPPPPRLPPPPDLLHAFQVRLAGGEALILLRAQHAPCPLSTAPAPLPPPPRRALSELRRFRMCRPLRPPLSNGHLASVVAASEQQLKSEPECRTLEVKCEPNNRLEVNCDPNSRLEVNCGPNNRLEVNCEPNNRLEANCGPNNRLEVNCEQNNRLEVNCGPNNRLKVKCKPNNSLEVKHELNNRVDVKCERDSTIEVKGQPESRLDVKCEPDSGLEEKCVSDKLEVKHEQNSRLEVKSEQNTRLKVKSEQNNRLEMELEQNSRLGMKQVLNSRLEVEPEQSGKLGTKRVLKNSLDINHEQDSKCADRVLDERADADNNVKVKSEQNSRPQVKPEQTSRLGMKRVLNNSLDMKREQDSKRTVKVLDERAEAEASALAAAIIARAVLLCRAQLYPGLHTILGRDPAHCTPSTPRRAEAAPPRRVECAWCWRRLRANRCAWYGPPPLPSDVCVGRVWRRVRGKRYLCACCPDGATGAAADTGGWYGKGYRKGRRRQRARPP